MLHWRSGLRTRLFLLGVVASLPFIALSGYRLWQHWVNSDQIVRESVLQATNIVRERIDKRVQRSDAMLDVLYASVHFDTAQRAYNDSLLTRTSRRAGSTYGNFYAYDAQGHLVGTARYRPILDSVRPRVVRLVEQLGLQPAAYIGIRGGSVVLTDSANVILFARGVSDGNTMRGLIALTVRVDSLAKEIDIPSILPGTVVTLIDTSGSVLAQSSDGRISVPDSAGTYDRNILALEDGVRFVPDSTGTTRILAHVRTLNAPWYINVSVPASAAMASLHQEFFRDAFVALIAFFSALTLAFVLGGRIVRPLDVLATDARTIARGVTDHRSRVSDASEIGLLADAFNHMADTVERRNAALGESERRYRMLFDSNPLPMWAWDSDTLEILAVNEAALEHYGYKRDTFLSLRITDIIDPVDHVRFYESRLPFSESRQHAGSWTHRTADGRKLEMDVVTTSSRRLGRASWLSVGIDISARREAERALAQSEEQLRQSQKLEAIGAFAGGIAHDFNNLLTGMLGYCDLALLELESTNPLRTDLEEIRKLAVRGADLTRQILAVSRKQVVQPTVIEPNAVLRGMDRLLVRLIGEHIRVETAFADDVPHIKADAGQLEQVMLNLASNARDAMPEGGTLQISTRSVDHAERSTRGLDADREWVAIAVRDTGIGMSEEVKDRIFEPFFTTKERGKGTGLGLPLAFGMVEQAGGSIRVDTTPNQGTTVTLYIPVAVEKPSAAATGEHEIRDLHGTETILLAEDEDAVRVIVTSALRRWGYRVLAASDGNNALEVAGNFGDHIHLLVTDVIMPGMNGRELAEQLQKDRPELRVLFASGYTDDATLLRGIRSENLPFVQKPFTTTELVQRVRDILDEQPRTR